jgi:hypothetical protein
MQPGFYFQPSWLQLLPFCCVIHYDVGIYAEEAHPFPLESSLITTDPSDHLNTRGERESFSILWKSRRHDDGRTETIACDNCR